MSVYDLIAAQHEQLEMFATKSRAVAKALDKINDKYGEFVITPALMMGMDECNAPRNLDTRQSEVMMSKRRVIACSWSQIYP